MSNGYVRVESNVRGRIIHPSSVAPSWSVTWKNSVLRVISGATASIVLTWAQESLDISVADRGGERTPTGGTPGGFGLAGMTERAALHGGHVEAGHSGDGFTVRLRLPVRPALQGERA